ncbi:AAA-ATPase At4g25835-like [Nymphaea colorata]|uniref:AAA+ ATPase domain-containing protein n=1 Tax=Nymphaea colorata TaxID=210225 RepID=A0A5K0V1S4_9MAGN|nr:AAA-ATPase At4g25835-like [Nymphaea colorata]
MEILAQLWSFLGLLTVLQNVLPSQLLTLLQSWWESLQDLLNPYSYFEIPEFNGYYGVDVNELYRVVHLYLSTLDGAASRRLTLTRPKNSGHISFIVSPNHTVEDSFRGHRLWWTHHVETVQDSLEEKRSFCLKLAKAHRKTILSDYLAEMSARAEEFERVSRDRRLYTNGGNASCELAWASVPFRHPATFDTLALEPELKRSLIDDLTAFANSREFYKRIGRPWKRGYLLYGPPGTGKSSLIAAMANFLHYDVYDLELTKVADNSELRALLIQTTNKSIIVIEDIDCSLDLTERMAMNSKKPLGGGSGSRRSGRSSSLDSGAGDQDSRVTLSGLLNFTDGLWSCCGEERIVVFTTNHKDNIDAALVRCGRMDMHVMLPTCGTQAFRSLAFNYLGVTEHDLFQAVDRCMQAGGALTPAEVGEIMIKNKDDADAAIRAVLVALQMTILRGRRECHEADEEELVARMEKKMSSFFLDQATTGGGHSEVYEKLRSPADGVKEKVGGRWQRKVRCFVRMKMLMRSPSVNGI